MKLLDTIPTTQFVALDAETVRYTEKYEDLSERFQSAWEYKNKQDGAIPDFEELSKSWENISSLYAEFSKVCAVSLAFLDKTGENLMVKEFYGEDEKLLLTELGEMLQRISLGGDFRLVAHAGKYFDYPYLSKRFVINGLDIPRLLDTAHLKPWESKNLCSNELWKMGGTGPGSSLQALCTVLEIPISKVDLVGDEVGQAYFKGELGRIGRYCSYDTIATFNIIRKLKKEPIFQFEDISYLGEAKTEEIIEKQPVLERIYLNKAISEVDKQEILELLGKKRLTKKSKGILIDMLHKLSVNSEMFSKDKPEIVAEKLKVVEDLIEKL